MLSVTFVTSGRLQQTLQNWVKALPRKIQKIDLSKPNHSTELHDAVPTDIWKLIQHREMALLQVTMRNKTCDLYKNDCRVVTTFVFGHSPSNKNKTAPIKSFEYLCTHQWPEFEIFTYTQESTNYRFRNLDMSFSEFSRFFVKENKLVSTS
jgi:hypothetical protein